DLVVDLRPDSETVGQVATVELSADAGEMLWVPRGFGHAFCTLEPDTEVYYKVDTPYRPDAELSVAWDDPALGVEWPVPADRVVLSDKDQHGLKLAEALAAVRAATLEADPGPDRRPAIGSQSSGRSADWMDVDAVGGERLPG
ncbi:MAG: dTDP-4-dehydrorhamnose 3,5-epimerase, partial [Acidimicrobiia bacterium]|nr:dTDP-4-dehydrorhamnose 3,5-epimerase [Acidimicrobiia bacterium]